MKKLLLMTALLAVSTAADATPARMAALSGNGGFADDTDFFLYPSVLGGLIPRTMLTYNGAFDGGIIFDDGQALLALMSQVLARSRATERCMPRATARRATSSVPRSPAAT